MTLSARAGDHRGYKEPVSFRDSKRVVEKVDSIAHARGMDRSSMYRFAMRFWLAAAGHLTDDEKKALGVSAVDV